MKCFLHLGYLLLANAGTIEEEVRVSSFEVRGVRWKLFYQFFAKNGFNLFLRHQYGVDALCVDIGWSGVFADDCPIGLGASAVGNDGHHVLKMGLGDVTMCIIFAKLRKNSHLSSFIS